MVPPIASVKGGIKEVLDVHAWERRVRANPKRLYGFILCTDEHEPFLNYLQKAWSTLDTLSGSACDVFTLEHQREGRATYLPLSTTAPVVTGDLRRIDTADGVVLPDRTECLMIRDVLFAKPESVILPGLAVFASIHTKKAVYYPCSELTSDAVSATFQQLFNSMHKAHRKGESRFDIFRYFVRLEQQRRGTQLVTSALTKVTLKDIFTILVAGMKLVLPL